MKWCTICLLSISILSCHNKESGLPKSKAVAAFQRVDTGHGVDPDVVAGSGNLNGTYINTRYGFYLSYPTDAIKMESEPDSHDGCIFSTTSNTELGRVYRIANVDPAEGSISLKTELEADMAYFREQAMGQPVKDVYSHLAKTFYVISARVDDKIFYRKGILLDGDDMAKVIFKYDVQQKARYDVIVADMAHSFHK